MVNPWKILELLFKTFYNLRFRITNIYRTSIVPDMLKFGIQISLYSSPNYLQVVIYMNRIKWVSVC